MTLRTERTDVRTWPVEQLKELFSESFPEFITADRLVSEYIGRVGVVPCLEPHAGGRG